MTHQDIISKLFSAGNGMLAADEGVSSANKRFKAINIPEDEEHRRQWRELLLTTGRLEENISGVILHDETARQSTKDGKKFLDVLTDKGIMPGIKVDKGLEAFEGSEVEQITKGLDTLKNELKEYKDMGMTFTKWRSVYFISETTPTMGLIDANATILATYAKTVVDMGMVPMVEPEILIKGERTIATGREVMEQVFNALFEKLSEMGVDNSKVILKTSFVLPGMDGPHTTAAEIAELTIDLFKSSVPKDLGGIVFLSGGLSSNSSFEYLAFVVSQARKCGYKMPITFCFSRALQLAAMKNWAGKTENVEVAQMIFKQHTELGSMSLA